MVNVSVSFDMLRAHFEIFNYPASFLNGLRSKNWELTTVLFSYFDRNEVWIILQKSALIAIMECLSLASGAAATFISVMTLVLTGHVISPSTAFMLVSFMSYVKILLSLRQANSIPIFTELLACFKRIERFLLLENIPFEAMEYIQSSRCQDNIIETYPQVLVRESLPKDKLVIQREIHETQDAVHFVSTTDVKHYKLPEKTENRLTALSLTCKLSEPGGKYLLQDVSFEASEKSLTVITGQVGSGKSTLLAAIAGEVTKSSGDIVCHGTVAYVPQTAWIFSGTVRENVLLGEQYDEKKYAEVIEACALREDINRFPNGDLTFVGEHGVVLSGGQRARVNLARALYADADVYLLDDPLSAVDAKVGELIFEQCICSLLKNKIAILVTYEKKHMETADQVVVLHKGSVLASGTFWELQDGGEKILNTILDAASTTNQKKSIPKPREGKKVAIACFKPESGSFDEYLEISEEEKATGKISSALYWDYFRAGMHPVVMISLVVLFLATQGLLSSYT